MTRNRKSTQKSAPSKAPLQVVGRDDGITAEFTDLWNAKQFVELFGDDARYVEEWESWIVWDGRRWKTDPKGTRVHRFAKQTARVLMKRALVELAAARRLDASDDEHKAQKKKAEGHANASIAWAKASQDARAIRRMIESARTEPKLTATRVLPEGEQRGQLVSGVRALDADPYSLNARNGTVDLRTGKRRPHRREDLITKLAGAEFNEKARAPRFERFLREVLPDAEVREFVQQFAGYSATGDVGERIWCMLHGQGKNGKSVLLYVLLKLLGEYACMTSPALLVAKKLEDHPTDVADLCGVRLAVSSELKKGQTWDEEKIKRLTGKDVLKARRMREDFWSFDPTHKLLVALNHKPRVKDDSESFWDRAALIEFNVRIPDHKVDRKLETKLVATEGPGILAWIVRGCVAWQRAGKLALPKAIVDATKQYRHDEDKLGRFLDERCAFGPKTNDWFEYTRDLTKDLNDWCEAQNLYTDSGKTLAERLQRKGCESKRGTGGAFGWLGVKLKKNLDKDGKPRKPKKTDEKRPNKAGGGQ